MWSEFLHHVFLQVPITASFGLAILAVFFVKNPAPNLERIIRLFSWLAFFAISGAAISGILSAPGILGGDGPPELSHHRNLGLIVWSIAVTATFVFEIGVRNTTPFANYIKSTGAVLWVAVAFASIGAGHWGGAVVHSDSIPWDLSKPAIENVEHPTTITKP